MPTRFTELFTCDHPLQQAGMGGMSPAVAVAVARAGALGMLSGARGRADLADQLDSVPEDLAIGVNFLLPFLDRAAVEVAAARTGYVEFFWDQPDPQLVETVRAGGALAGWQVGSADDARAAQDAGCAVVVAQGVEAGGHVRGTTGLLPLLDEVTAAVELPVIAAGGIGSGRAMAAALTAGADAVRVGTRFVAAEESNAHPEYISALIAARAEDTVLTTAFGEEWPDAPHRVLRSAVTAGEARGTAQSWSVRWPRDDSAAPVGSMALYAGQSVVGVTRRQSAAEIVEELVEGARRLLG